MVETNINFNGKENIINSICWILSVISWLLLVLTGLLCFSILDSKFIVWTFYKIPITKNYYDPLECADNDMGFYPIQMSIPMIYLVFGILVLFSIVAFIYYMVKSTCKKDQVIFDGMNGQWTKFHFIPIFFAAFLFLVGETIGDKPNHSNMNICGMIFVLLGLASLIFIYLKTDLPGDWLPATIKKGTYSCLIALEWYYFCYDICNIRINNLSLPGDKEKIRPFSAIFNILVGIGGLVFAFFFKDVIVAAINLLIYLGYISFFFSIDSIVRGWYNGMFEGIVDIAMIILFLVEIGYLIIKHKLECLK